MKISYKSILKRLTGFSTPIGGISWDPNNTEKDVAKRVITFLEDKRVLYNSSELEIPQHCVQSILQIREFLTKEIGELDENSKLSGSLKAMRASCRKFLNTLDSNENTVLYAVNRGDCASWTFMSSLGELRGVFGIHIAIIALKYKLSIEEDLASIMPDEPGK